MEPNNRDKRNKDLESEDRVQFMRDICKHKANNKLEALPKKPNALSKIKGNINLGRKVKLSKVTPKRRNNNNLESEAKPSKVIRNMEKEKVVDPKVKLLEDIRESEETVKRYNEMTAGASDLNKNFKATCDATKRRLQGLEEARLAKTAGTTRSGKVRGVPKILTHGNSTWFNKGNDDASEPYDKDEQEYLQNALDKIDKLGNLGLEHLKYLTMYVILDDLKAVADEKLESIYHNRYKEIRAKGLSVTEMFDEIYSGLFTCKQLGYIQGLLAKCFNTGSNDTRREVDYEGLSYMTSVLTAEAIMRIVKHLYKLHTVEESLNKMKRLAGENLGHDFD